MSRNQAHRIASCRMDLAIIKMLVGLCKLMVNKRSRVSRANGSIFSLLVCHNGHK